MLLHSPFGIHILQWIVSAIALMVTGAIVKGMEVSNFLSALIATFVIQALIYTVGLFIFALTLPLTLITMGLFIIVIGGIVLRIAAWILPGFSIKSWGAAFIGAIILAIINDVLHFFIV